MSKTVEEDKKQIDKLKQLKDKTDKELGETKKKYQEKIY